MARMTWLTAPPPSALLMPASHARLARQSVRRWRLRSRRGVLLPQRQLMFQVRDAFGLLGDLAISFGQLPTQPLDLPLQAFGRLVAIWAFRVRHSGHGTPTRVRVQGPELLRFRSIR
jgi:hypothetical protein